MGVVCRLGLYVFFFGSFGTAVSFCGIRIRQSAFGSDRCDGTRWGRFALDGLGDLVVAPPA